MKKKSTKTGFHTRQIQLRPEAEWIPISIPPLVKAMTWEAAQRQLQVNKSFAKRNLKLDHLLTGLIYCRQCQGKMSIKHSGKKNLIISYYVCNSQVNGHCIHEGGRCSARRIPSHIIDEIVWNKLYEVVKDENMIASYLEENDSDDVIEKVRKTLGKLELVTQKINNKKTMILRWFKQQLISATEAEQQLTEIHKQLLEMESNKKKFQGQLDLFMMQIQARDAEQKVRGKNIKIQFCTAEEKKSAVHSIVAKVLVQRIDDTWGKNSTPELIVDILLL